MITFHYATMGIHCDRPGCPAQLTIQGSYNECLTSLRREGWKIQGLTPQGRRDVLCPACCQKPKGTK